MREQKPHVMLIALVFVLLTSGIGYLFDILSYNSGVFSGVLSTFAYILLFLFTIIMEVGLAHYALCVSRKKKVGFDSLFEGFAYTGRSLGVRIMVYIYIILWGILIMAAAILLLSILLSIAILASAGMAVYVVLSAIVIIAAVVAMVVVCLRYNMAIFALVDDPNQDVFQCIRRSRTMMRKNKSKLFWLLLSFIGWAALIGVVVVAVHGIGIWLIGPERVLNDLQKVLAEEDTTAMLVGLENLAATLQYLLRWWTLLGEVLAFPLLMWLTIFKQTSLAFFYNYASGYDYHAYMNTPADSINPPNDFYHSPTNS